MANYKIESIEGIGPAYAAKLRSAGVKTTNALLKAAGAATGRRSLADRTGLEESLLLTWVNMADLLRIRGVGSEYAELLEKTGVDTVKELRHRNPENLQAAMQELNAEGRRTVRRVPNVEQVADWVEHAKELEAVVSH